MLVFYAQNIYFLQKNMVKEQAKGKVYFQVSAG